MASTDSVLAYLRYGFASLVTLTFAYGAYVVMTILTWYHLRARNKRQAGPQTVILGFTIVMFILTLVDYVTSALVLEAAIIEGPAATPEAVNAESCSPAGLTNLIVSNLQILLSDGLMVYRTYALFDDTRLVGLRMLPIILWLGLAGITVAGVVTTCGLGAGEGGPVNLTLYNAVATAMLSATAALQVLTTGMITLKLLWHRRTLIKSGASLVDGRKYVSLAGLLAESAMLYTVASVAYIPIVLANAPIDIWWAQVVGSLVFLNPAFIILRVVMGQSYASTPGTGSVIQFSTTLSMEQPRRSVSIPQESSLFHVKPTPSDAESFAMYAVSDGR